jgi:hypothetical protein
MQTVLPVWVLRLMSKYSNRRNLKHARHTAELANAVTRELVDLKAEAALQGKGNKDILSLLGAPVISFYPSLPLTLWYSNMACCWYLQFRRMHRRTQK